MIEKKIVYKTELPKQEKETRFFRMIGVVVLIFCLSVISFVGGRIFQEYHDSPVGIPFWGVISNVNRSEFDEDADADFNVRIFWEVWDSILQSYVDDTVINEEDMYYGAIKGMVNSLGDPATVFLSPEEALMFKKQNEGKYYEGIGIELGYRDGSIAVIAPIEGSPAKAAGIQSGDVIVSVDEELVKKSDTIYDIVHKIRGDAGTEVMLTVMRSGESSLREYAIVRGEITVPSMTLEKHEESDVYILKIGRFTEASLSTWTSKWDEKIEKFLKSGSDSLIIDLRGNPGGFFDAGIYGAEEFLPKGTMVSMQEDRRGKLQEYKVKRAGTMLDANIIILVDEGSASASEIFAGALQQNERAEIVGVNTYGKGTAQSVVNYSDGSTLHLTIVKWLLPDGSWINKDNVIKPDYEIEISEEDFQQGEDPQLQKAIELLSK